MILNQSWGRSVLLRHCFLKQLEPVLKSLSVFSLIRPKAILLKKNEYKLLYNFPLIRVPVALIKSGYTNIVISAALSPFIYYYYESIIPCLVLFGGVCIHCILVFGLSKVLGNVVGKIYVNKEGEVENVMISSIDNYGKRIDRIHKASDLINCEFSSKFSGQMGFIQISVENSDIQYKLSIRNCKIHDQLIWENLFGKVPLHNIIRKKSNKIIITKKID